MRVLHLTYENPFTGRTGVSAYCRDLLPALARHGVEVGLVHTLSQGWGRRPALRGSEAFGVRLFGLANSPLNPDDSLQRPWQDSHQVGVETLIRTCLERYRPDILHVHTLQGYPGVVLDIARERGISRVVTLHDFWAICPRSLLMQVDGTACSGPDGGVNCLQFCAQPLLWRRRLYRAGMALPAGRLRQAFLGARAVYLRSARSPGSQWTPEGRALRRLDPRLLAAHATRSASLIRALNGADRLLAVSEFARGVFARHGVDTTRVQTLPLALALDGVTWRPRPVPQGPIRFGFLGRAVPLKGAHVFAGAARQMPAERARFLLFGSAPLEARRHLDGLSGPGRIEFRGPYTRRDLAAIFDAVDVVVVPSVAQETVGLVTLEAHAAGVPVIGSRIGAIPEYIRDGEDGLLFTPGDPRDLCTAMTRIIETPSLVAEMSARTRAPMTLAAHLDALLDVYATVCGKGGEALCRHSSA